MANSKIVYGGKVLMDLTADTIKADKLLKGYTAHGADGEVVNGACTFDADTQDATAADAEILETKVAYVRGVRKTGTMKNNGAASIKISKKDDSIKIPQGYHDGGGTAALDDTEKAKLLPNNIREGVTLFGVVGEMSGSEGVNAQSREVTSSTVDQTVLPENGYTHLAQVVVKAIPYVESNNAAGGVTVTIG